MEIIDINKYNLFYFIFNIFKLQYVQIFIDFNLLVYVFHANWSNFLN